jgi:hypothetical protein
MVQAVRERDIVVADDGELPDLVVDAAFEAAKPFLPV